MKLVIVCVECGIVAHAPFKNNRLFTNEVFQELGWILSCIDPKELVLAPVCGPCAEQVYAPEVLAEAKRTLSL